jgi:hypothetical protein
MFCKSFKPKFKRKQKRRKKKLRKEKKAPGAEFGLDPKAARGPSLPHAEAVSSYSLSCH